MTIRFGLSTPNAMSQLNYVMLWCHRIIVVSNGCYTASGTSASQDVTLSVTCCCCVVWDNWMNESRYMYKARKKKVISTYYNSLLTPKPFLYICFSLFYLSLPHCFKRCILLFILFLNYFYYVILSLFFVFVYSILYDIN